MKSLNDILRDRTFESSTEVCPGCENHCTVKRFMFANGKSYHSGNQCEKIYSNGGESVTKGFNMFAWKNMLLWEHGKMKKGSGRLRIGLPRALGIYENYPFWYTLLTECGMEVVLSKSSTNSLYEKGIRSIMADNICFPAKLMHGHIMNLIEKKVDRILYPWVVFERQEDNNGKNSFNCPVVSGYSDVIKSSIRPKEKYGIEMDSPVVSFKDEDLLRQSCHDYLSSLGIQAATIESAIDKAISTQQNYLNALEDKALEVLRHAEASGRTVVLLAARPYHIDPLIEHKISQSIADMDIDVITENVAAHAGAGVFKKINALSQWAYPNRIFKAAYFVGKQQYERLHMVELTSFGCGPDAFILDEVRSILSRHSKNLTVLKIDDVNNIGSLKLRVRSLIESSRERKGRIVNSEESATMPYTTRPFMDEDRKRTILAPYFGEGYSEYLASVFAAAGYNMESLPPGNKADAEEGLQIANNDICYPATIVLGSVINALKSGKYKQDDTAIVITQTGGQCRASNYYSLIKNALVKYGYADVPVLSVGLSHSIDNNQPGFVVPWKQIARLILYTMLYADTLHKLYYPAVARAKDKEAVKQLYDHYTEIAQPLVRAKDYDGLVRLARRAATDFAKACDMSKDVPQVGLVGEIYVKYNPFSNLYVSKWLIERDIEVVPATLTGFFSTAIPNAAINKRLHIKESPMSPLTARLVNMYLMHVARRFDRACRSFKHYRKFTDIYEIQRLSRKVINPAADFGEGWFLSGEICHLAESGIKNVISVQPFGCIANHIISKGIEKRLKSLYSDLSLLFLDFDSGTSEANVQNRLHFMLNH
ncbi:MAG: 2-hydroxyacyl-CoA dehydratase [Paludibacteraceae bacterium]|nr:2-hydroxyacyl-CoA dehydratase [Paludibacteraceae bacterium]